MKVLILGASGYVGARLYFDLKAKFTVTGTYYSNKLSDDLRFLDVTKKAHVKKIISDINPEVIIHVANNPKSKWCEENPEEAESLNVNSSYSIAEISRDYGSKVIYVSTMGAINHGNLYQETKSRSEKIFQKLSKGSLILRPSVGLGMSPNRSSEGFFNKLLSHMVLEKEFEADISLKFQPTYLYHISQVIEECINKNIWGEVIPISLPEVLSSYQIAKDILEAFNLKVHSIDNKRPKFTDVKDVDEELRKFNLQTFTYRQIVQKVIYELKNFDKYRI